MTTNTTRFGLSLIGQISIPVQDLERAITFYKEALGMKFLFQVPNMAFFDCGGIRLMLGIPEKTDSYHRSSVIYYKVDHIENAYNTLTERGVKFRGKPHCVAKLPNHDLWMAFLDDIDGNLIALMSEVPNA